MAIGAGLKPALAQPQAALDPATLGAPFSAMVPRQLGSDFVLSELSPRAPGSPPTRDLDIPSPQAGGKPVRIEKVSVRAGARAMYALTSGQLFANLKMEQSDPARFRTDRSLSEEALRNRHASKTASRTLWLAGQAPDARARFDAAVEPGRAPAEIASQSVRGIDVLWASDNIYGASDTPAIVLFFAPRLQVIVSASLLNQKQSAFTTAREFRLLRESFTDHYAQVLAGVESAAPGSSS